MIKYNGVELNSGHFPDGSLMLHMKIDSYASDDILEWYYENDAELFTLICARRHLEEAGVPSVSLYLPYLPHARMDRAPRDIDVFTLKYFCEVINSLNFSKVIVCDAHSNVSIALLERVQNMLPLRSIQRAITDANPDVIFFPDEGAMKRYSEAIRGLHNGEVAFGMKQRDWDTGKILGLEVYGADVKDKNILIIDDICSYGGTFHHSSIKLRELGGAKISLYITHCEENIFKGEILKNDLISKIYTTDSLPKAQTHERIEVFDI
jgi:ribose-phosphate pyrophosphokinase